MLAPVSTSAALLALLASQLALAQTSTECNPTEKKCPDDPALGSSHTTDFTQSLDYSLFEPLAGTTLTQDANGALFSIKSPTDAPTLMSNKYIFFGQVDVTMQAAPGIGIVTSIVLESDDLDEIDWEWTANDAQHVQTNFFGKGNTTAYNREITVPVADVFSSFHTYSLVWTSESITWLIDGVSVRTLTYDDPLTVGGINYPQTPCRVRVGTWVGGGPNSAPGTKAWAGGDADFSNGNTYNAYYKKIVVTDANTGASSYSFGDNSGSFQSIKINGDVKKALSMSPSASPSSTATKASSTSTMSPSLTVTTSTKAATTTTATAKTTTPSGTAKTTATSATSTAQPTTTSAPDSAGVVVRSSWLAAPLAAAGLLLGLYL